MATIKIHDLDDNRELDNKALKNIMGGVRNRETPPILMRKGFDNEKRSFLDLIRKN